MKETHIDIYSTFLPKIEELYQQTEKYCVSYRKRKKYTARMKENRRNCKEKIKMADYRAKCGKSTTIIFNAIINA